MSPTRSIVLLLFPQGGCANIRYLTHPANGKHEIIARRTPIRQVLDNPDTDGRIRAFGSVELALPESRDCRSHAVLNRRHAAWNALAVPARSITPEQ